MIRSERENGTLVLTIDRVEQRNALSNAMYDQLREGLVSANDDLDCHAVIITGAGGHFTAGNDLKEFQGERPAGDSPALAFLRTLASVDVSVIAAVEGYAVGIGVTLLQHCDFVYAGDTATFSLPFISLALCPEGGSSLLMERIVGRRHAAKWLLLGEKFGAREALDAGLLTSMSQSGCALDDARRTAAALCTKPIEALRLTKRMLREPGRAELMSTFDNERENFNERLKSDEAQQIFRRFFKR